MQKPSMTGLMQCLDICLNLKPKFYSIVESIVDSSES